MTQSYPNLVEVTIRRGQRLRLLRWLYGYGGGGHLYAPIVDCSQTRGVQVLAYCASVRSRPSQLAHKLMMLTAFCVALDPGYGHYEFYSLTRFLHDRAPNAPGDLLTEASHTTVAQSFGASLILPLWSKWLELHAGTLIGHGNGRYGSAQLSDATYNTRNGSIAALREQQGLVGLIAHPSAIFDVYAYGGLEQQTAAYGLIPADNSACATNFANLGSLPSTAQYGGVGRVRQIAGGFTCKAYRGPLGYVTVGPEVEYVKDTTYVARNGTSAETNNTIVYFTMRYYP